MHSSALAQLPSAADGVDVDPRAPSNSQELVPAVLDAIGYPILLLSTRAEVLYANPLGRAAVRSDGVLLLREDVVSGRSPEDQAELSTSLSRATHGLRTLLMLRGADMASRHVAAVVPISVDVERSCAMLLLSTGAAGSRLSRHLYALRRALTPAEQQVFEQLCDGMNPSEIALANGVALSTVRSQICSVRAKTETSSIQTLLTVALGIPPMGPQVV